MRLTDCFRSFDLYLQSCGFAKTSRESYGRTLSRFEKYLEYSDCSCDLEQLKKEDITGFLAGCEEIGEKRSSVILRLLILKKFFGWLKEERIIAADPAAALPVPKEEKQVPRFVSVQQIESLLNQPDTSTPGGLRDRALLEVIYSAGLRITEALSLKLTDINYEQGFVYVRNGKGGKSRNIPIGKTALQWVERYVLEGRRKMECDCTEFLFLTQNGLQLSRQSAAAAVRAYAQTAGLPEWITPHSLRHAMATHMLEAGAKLPYIQEQLGHACMESTRIYLAVRSEELKNVHSAYHPRA